jgi:farnesyl-diphosphate farnesyltransferase
MRAVSELEISPEDFCRAALPEVSRTFALNIPMLPKPLDLAVTVAYLLCRIADTLEDEALGPAEGRQPLLDELSRITTLPAGWSKAAVKFAESARQALRPQAPEAEVRLLVGTQHVLEALSQMPEPVQTAVAKCVRTMSDGMGEMAARLEREKRLLGLRDLDETLEYCYYVAGVVGEMLTALFIQYSPAVAAQRAQLESRAVAFGRALQLTNILKDIREDLERGSCWLPLTTLQAHGLTPQTLLQPENREQAVAVLDSLIGVAHREVVEAFEYVMALPKDEEGIRLFCLWPLFMAVLTLQKLQGNPAVFSPRPVKISRDAVRRIVGLTRAISNRDWALKLLFVTLTATLTPPAARRLAST